MSDKSFDFLGLSEPTFKAIMDMGFHCFNVISSIIYIGSIVKLISVCDVNKL